MRSRPGRPSGGMTTSSGAGTVPVPGRGAPPNPDVIAKSLSRRRMTWRLRHRCDRDQRCRPIPRGPGAASKPNGGRRDPGRQPRAARILHVPGVPGGKVLKGQEAVCSATREERFRTTPRCHRRQPVRSCRGLHKRPGGYRERTGTGCLRQARPDACGRTAGRPRSSASAG